MTDASCAGCDTVWPMQVQLLCHCSSCHQSFNGITLFDRHRRNGQCQNPALMRDRGGEPLMRLTQRGYARVWVSTAERLDLTDVA